MKTTLVLIVAITALVCNAHAARDPKCSQPVESGRCLAYNPSFAFDTAKKECVQFIYGGCGGNDNRFKSKIECEKACGQ